MLSSRPLEGRMRVARNLLPLETGGLEARAGAVQVLPGDVTDLAVWGTRLVVERDGRIVVASGGAVQDMGQAGRFVRGTAFQALVANAQREERFYVADGLNPLWYLARRGGVTVREPVVNTVLDDAGMPYPLPVPTLAATWRGRLWVDEGANRLRHCQFDRPAEWDPLWTLEFQGDGSDRRRALLPFGDVLLVGFEQAIWAVTGKSQYDWQVAAMVNGRGCGGPRSMASDGAGAWWVCRDGIFRLGGDTPLSDDVRELFGTPHMDSQAVIEPRTRRLFVLVGGRVLAMNLDSGLFGEVVATGVRGLFVLDGRVGWWGEGGVWLMAADDLPDTAIDGTRTAVQAVMESWDEVPNPAGGGRALLNRGRFVVQGSPRGNATYTATADGERSFVATFSLSDVAVDAWAASAAPVDGSGEAWPVPGVFREVVPRLAGRSFRHRLEAGVYMRLDEFKPEFRFAGVATAGAGS